MRRDLGESQRVPQDAKLGETNITTTPWIRIHKPCTPDLVSLFDQFKVPRPILADKLDGKANAGQACADDENICVVRHDQWRC